LILLGAVSTSFGARSAGVDVTTYHYDAMRTGWNGGEAALSPDVVRGKNFGLRTIVALDDYVEGQPLVATSTTAEGTPRELIYVATMSNHIYAIDAETGAIVKDRQLSDPVPRGSLPGGCTDNGPNVGVESTPVIDLDRKTLYVIAYELSGAKKRYRLYALDLATLSDRIPPREITAQSTLDNGTVYTFDPEVSRQHAGLAESNGRIYAAFASFCDYEFGKARGWLLGWDAATLNEVAAAHLDNRLANSNSSFFLTSVWMSGASPAIDPAGNIFVVTGNSDPKGGSYTPPKDNLQESVVAVSGNLASVVSFFTPSNVDYLDKSDVDFGSGSVLLLPDVPGAIPHLAAAAGKDGKMYLLDRDRQPDGRMKAVAVKDIGGCWCAQSFFLGSDGAARIVSSGGTNAVVWRLQTAPTVDLIQESKSENIPRERFPGFFTVISSNGQISGTAIIWAIGSASNGDKRILGLYALDAKNGKLLYHSDQAGEWPETRHKANVVPVVANGRVYVASYQKLAIFGIGPPLSVASVAASTGGASTASKLPSAAHINLDHNGERWISGTIKTVSGPLLTLQTRKGETRVDAKIAIQSEHNVPLVEHNSVTGYGYVDSAGLLHARTITRASDDAGWWIPDHCNDCRRTK
jgi:outer membrane protein assembly factor BamB